MAGHSRWAKVKRFKGGIDAKRAQEFRSIVTKYHGTPVSRLFNRNEHIIVSREAAPEVQKWLDQLEENDDVKEVYHNAEFAGEN